MIDVPPPPALPLRWAIPLTSVGIAVLFGGAVAWAHYGDAIYFDLLAAGLAGCLF